MLGLHAPILIYTREYLQLTLTRKTHPDVLPCSVTERRSGKAKLILPGLLAKEKPKDIVTL